MLARLAHVGHGFGHHVFQPGNRILRGCREPRQRRQFQADRDVLAVFC
ncbi:MAG: hypothetical protein ACRDNZ_10940 [Streptosporangiaceae bacterium]